MTAIAHLATPVSFGFKDPVPILHAAVNGTKTVLNSALINAGPQLKTVVLMSSIASVKSSHPAPHTFTENDWNDFAEKMCEEQGTETPGPVIYSASKVASERAFWEVKEKNKPTFTMASVNPVYGPYNLLAFFAHITHYTMLIDSPASSLGPLSSLHSPLQP